MIKKFESFSDDFKEDLKYYLIDVHDMHDTELDIWTKEEFLNTSEAKNRNLDSNQYNYLDKSNFVVKTRIKPNPGDYINHDFEYSLDGAIKAAKHNYELLKSIENGLHEVNYKFYIKDQYDCYFFINHEE